MMVGVIVETRRPLTRPRKASGGLAIRLLGEIRVQRGAMTVALPASKRTRALLGFLAATATPQPRQTLCDLLWDGPDDPRAALRWSLTKLRPLVNDAGVERLKADRGHISFSPDDALIDVARLDALLRGGPEAAGLAEIEEAAALLQGEFLDGLDLPSCYRFHHWCLTERERWGALRRRVLSLAVARLDGDHDRALPYARAMVAADPLSEASHGRLVALLAALGRRKDAQEHYDYARDMLRREMGAPLIGDLRPPPAPRRSSLSPESAGEDAAIAPSPAPVSKPAAATRRGLIGRVGEKHAILASLEGLLAGAAPGAMLFMGEPGIGKSSLLEFVAEQAAQKGARVVAARCFEAEAVRPYGCWADALGSLIKEAADPSARRDLALFLPSRELPLSDEGSRTRLFAAVMTILNSNAAQRPLVLMIDDLQWIDEGSSSLLHYVLRASDKPARFLFVGSARADEIDDNPWCKRVVSALAQNGAVKRIKLGPLGADEAAQFFGPEANADDVAAAISESGGNPLFLTELAVAGRQGRQPYGRDLDALIGDRIARLDESERDLIVFASATSRDFKPELLGAAMDLPELQLMARIDRLERRGLLKPCAEGRLDFAHDLIRRTTYRSLSQSRRRLIHRQIARALNEAARRDQSLAGELAYHAGAAGDHALAVLACIAAGEHCLRLFANTAALDAADRGLGHLAKLPASADRAHGHIALLKVKVFAGASPGIRIKPKLVEELQQAVEAAELMGLRDYDAALGWHMISWWNQQSNNTVSAQQAILRAEMLSRPLGELTHGQQLASTGRCLLEVEGDVQRARTFLREADQIAARLDQNFVELDWGRGLIARWDGDLAKAQESMRRALTLARLREDRWREMECLVWIVKIAIEGDRLGEVGAVCDEIDAIATRIGDGPAPVADALRALARMLDKDGAEPELQLPLGALRALDDKAQLAYVLNQIAVWRFGHGRLEAARAAATEALGAAQAVRRTTEIVVASSILAHIEARSGDARKAVKMIESLMANLGDVSFLSARARAELDRAGESVRIPTPVQTATF
jgi:DNA-binding SARP family transcriptional activator/tetratricopeptide (TPR) repeat protein